MRQNTPFLGFCIIKGYFESRFQKLNQLLTYQNYRLNSLTWPNHDQQSLSSAVQSFFSLYTIFILSLSFNTFALLSLFFWLRSIQLKSLAVWIYIYIHSCTEPFSLTVYAITRSYMSLFKNESNCLKKCSWLPCTWKKEKDYSVQVTPSWDKRRVVSDCFCDVIKRRKTLFT